MLENNRDNLGTITIISIKIRYIDVITNICIYYNSSTIMCQILVKNNYNGSIIVNYNLYITDKFGFNRFN